MKSIGIVGCGNLGVSLLEGIISKNIVKNENIIISKRNIKPIQHYTEKGIQVVQDNSIIFKKCDTIIIALKPFNTLSILQEFSSFIDPTRHTIISVATGITIEQIETSIDGNTPIFRAMPNTAAGVNESITCLCGNESSRNKIKNVENIFNCVGQTIEIDENLMEAATVLGACGIAYVLRFIRSMIQGGIQIGFDSKTASKIVYQTVKGASELLIKGDNHPEAEIDKVTTPKGCTIAGLNEMEHNGFSSALIKGILTSKEAI